MAETKTEETEPEATPEETAVADKGKVADGVLTTPVDSSQSDSDADTTTVEAEAEAVADALTVAEGVLTTPVDSSQSESEEDGKSVMAEGVELGKLSVIVEKGGGAMLEMDSPEPG